MIKGAGFATVVWAVWTMCFGFGSAIPVLALGGSLTLEHMTYWLAAAFVVYPVFIVCALRARK